MVKMQTCSPWMLTPPQLVGVFEGPVTKLLRRLSWNRHYECELAYKDWGFLVRSNRTAPHSNYFGIAFSI